MALRETGIHRERWPSERPEYTGGDGPQRDRNTQGEMALRETGIHRTGIHRERWPSVRPEYTGRVCPRRDRKQETTM